jgi:hypothetical protein
VDAGADRHCRDIVALAAVAKRTWKLRSALLSPRYTTRWNELLQV